MLKTLGPVLRADAEASAFGGPVDVALEDRHERCVALQVALRALSPRLHELTSDAKGRPAQLSTRLLKSLDRCCAAVRE